MFSLPSDTTHLLLRLVDCIDHLRVFPSDHDACKALQRGLEQLANGGAQPALVAEFAGEVARLLAQACAERCPEGEALHALKQCLDLLSWQVELSDPQHGLVMDCSEQRELLAALALRCQAGTTAIASA